MDFIVTMRPHPGDKTVSVAEIRMYDEDGVQLEGQFLLEAETAETRLSLPPGGKMVVTEHERRNVVDAEQKAGVPIGTAEREVNWESPNTPQPKIEMQKDEEEYAKKYHKGLEEQRKQHEAEQKKLGEPMKPAQAQEPLKPAVDVKYDARGATADMSKNPDPSARGEAPDHSKRK